MPKRKVAVILFYDNAGQVLLQERKNHSKFGEVWAFFGGGIEKDETPEQALQREIFEELEYTITNYEYIGVYANIRQLFMSPIENKQEKFIQHEGSGMKLFSIKEAKKLKFMPGDVDALLLAGEKLKELKII